MTLSPIVFVCLAGTLSAFRAVGSSSGSPLWRLMAQGSTGLSGSLPCPSWGWSQHPPPLPGEGPLPFTAAIQGQNASLPAVDTILFHVTLFPASLGNKYSRYSKCLFLSAAISEGPCHSLSTQLLFETAFQAGTDRGEKPLPPTEVFFQFFSLATGLCSYMALLKRGCMDQSFGNL